MAKAEKTTKATKPVEKDEPVTFKYGVSDIADKLGIDASAVRVKLRNADVEKAGKSYGWDTKAELAEVIEQISTPAKAKAAEKPAKKADKAAKGKSKDENEKPVKKPKAKKPKDDEDD